MNSNKLTTLGSLNQLTLDHLMEGLQLISHDWKYLYVNQATVKQGQFPREELIGHTMMEKYPGIENSKMFQTLRKCMKGRVSAQIENEFTFPNGSKGWFQLSIQPVPEGLFILSAEITRRKFAENQLKELNENFEELVKTRTAQLESSNKDILDSIFYAKRIQNALLPGKKKFTQLFNEAFLVFKPKDIVSGDFYWYKKIDDNIIIVAADCTGHGVPGALMSILSIERLGQVVSKTQEPAIILNNLNKSMCNALSNSNTYKNSYDGMDIAVCSINLKSKTLDYAGAKRPIWIIKKDKKSIKVIKANKTGIGGPLKKDFTFEEHHVQLETGDQFYLFSDGYADTFGGKDGKKLKLKKFKELLLAVKNRKMKDQEIYLETFIEEWMHGTEQIDDILIMGVRI